MVNESEIKASVEQCRGSGRTFAEFLAESLKDKLIEIYVGDSYEEISTEQVSTAYPAAFCGKIVSAYRECLIIASVYVDKSKTLRTGNLLFINERAIRALKEIDGKGVMEDMFLRSRESLEVKKLFE
jgi:hypothetical protein